MDPGESNDAFSTDGKQLPVLSKNKLVFAASIFLVSVPVFIQAPLVRLLPWLSLALTLVLVGVGWQLLHRAKTQILADLLLGFAWTWFCGSIYWGWFRWEPFLHLPIEAIGLPFAVWGIACNRGKVGNFFYMGSLLGTAVTDLYFYLVDLMPHWRLLMQVDESAVRPIFQSAIAQIQTSWGMGCAITLAAILVIASFFPLHSQKLHWWSFSGAVLSTILVDSLFWLAASIA